MSRGDSVVRCAVVPAAGASRRFGGAKLLEVVGGEPLLARTLRVVLAAGFRPVVAVLGSHRERLRPIAGGPGVEIVENERWRRGMGSSIASGVAHLLGRHSGLSGVVVVPADLPTLEPAVLEALPRAAEAAALPMAAVTWPGAPLQAPAWFSREVLPELLGLRGDRGARRFLRQRPDRVATICLERPLADLDRRPDR